ncbi:fumarylacetoacetate hydrolase family protein [Nocardioides sp. YIM 152315]|uniref:fumarylacetoacetate hydrolase family protein n=1 Tax=Nocardioides sp. YIM 152315 TaxID=3031760 RepID=UPI0023DA9177|nr:fumarylacetoacetate hydrolase family protein [Nocardioides sp. YIM 152315]MDF1604232.1 fumarylacetoacetate hydrolase family protein [Nocardioides sp. YIM 152315]
MTGLDPRIARGTSRMLAFRDEAIAVGAEPLGWKAGFGAQASLASLAIDRPLVGFLTRDRLLSSGATVSVAAWTRPVLEAEVAAHLASDIGAGATPVEALAAVGGWSVAIELADVGYPPEDVELILAGNIFHRLVLLGPVVPARPSSLSVSVLRDGERVAETSDPETLTGGLGHVLSSMADTLAACGAALRAGDVVITGSVIPPVPLEDGATWIADAPGLGQVDVRLG